MRRNWYAAGLLLLLLAVVFSAGVYMDTSTQRLDQKLTAACACMEQGEFTQAEAAFRDAADYAQQASSLWLLMIRRSLVDQLNQTLATLPHYATADNRADLSVEAARAREQTRQIRQSCFGRL